LIDQIRRDHESLGRLAGRVVESDLKERCGRWPRAVALNVAAPAADQ
jgi:hypothetical protein